MASVEYDRPPIWDVIERGGKPYNPLFWQAQHIHSRKERFIIAACGRRAGKTSAMKAEIAREILKPVQTVMGVDHSPLIYVIGPTTETSMKVWQPIWDMFVPPDSGNYVPPLGFMHETHDKNRRFIKLINGVEIYGKTAEDPVGIQGDRVTLAVMDESQDVRQEAWGVLMPGLSDSRGRLFAIGIPKGKGPFRSYWEMGQGDDPSFYSCSVPTTANPVFLDIARDEGYGDDVVRYLREKEAPTLTEDDFLRSYMGQWIEQDGQVFKNLDSVFDTPWGYAHSRMNTAMGLDIGKMNDFTVAYVGDLTTSKFLARDRFVGLDYSVAVPRIAKMYRAFGCSVIQMDTTGGGIPVADFLRKEGCNVLDYTYTQKSKAELIMTMAREVERALVHLPKDDKELRREMELFEATVNGTNVKYDAPKGYHDDCVNAAALLIHLMSKRRNFAKSPIVGSYLHKNRAVALA